MAGCCSDNVIMTPQGGVAGPSGPAGAIGADGAAGPQGTNGTNGGQEIYQARKIIVNLQSVPQYQGGSLVSTTNPYILTILTATQLNPFTIAGGLLKNVFYAAGTGNDTSGPTDLKYQVWWRQSFEPGNIFNDPCQDASLLGFINRVYIDIDNALKADVNNYGAYRTVILG